MMRQDPFSGKEMKYKAVPRRKARLMRGMGWKVHTDNPKHLGLIMCKAF